MQRDYYRALRALTRGAMLSEAEIAMDAAVRVIVPLGESIRWIDIRGNTDFARELSPRRCAGIMENVLTGAARAMCEEGCVAFQMRGDGNRIYLRIGCPGPIIGTVSSSLRALYPGICLGVGENIPPLNLTHGGVLTGYPSYRGEEAKGELPVDELLRGLGKEPFCLTVLARLERMDSAVATKLDWIMRERQVAVGDSEQQYGGQDGVSYRVVNCAAQEYLKRLESASEIFTYAGHSALWTVECIYAAQNTYTAGRLGGLLCATLNGDVASALEAVTCRRMSILEASHAIHLQSILSGNFFLEARPQEYSLNPNPLGTFMSSRELARLLALPRNEYAGYFVDQFVEFDVDNRPGRGDGGEYVLGDIVRSCQADALPEGGYAIRLDDLTRHALIVGLTGGGKTNTSKGLLSTLWRKHGVPFLVIESAKREYWELSMLADEAGGRAFSSLNVFTVGDENPRTASPFRLNPMEAAPGIALQTHIDYLLSTFKAAFELYPPMPYVLETAVYKVYEDRGWDIVTGENRYGLNRYPMLRDLEAAVVEVTDSLHYDSEVASNVKAALTARIHSLMNGSKDAMMNTARGIDMDYLLSRPTVLELEDLGDDDTKAFVIGILLVRIYEHRKANQYATSDRPGGGKSLGHVIMVEEAHRLLRNVQGGGEGNQSRANAVEFFCNMLAEIRSFGQGFFIADQVPTKLAPDTLKNTNLKIIHRTVMQEDREAVGRAMNMTPEQTAYLSALRVGYAAVFGEGDNRPKLVRFPLQVNAGGVDRREFIQDCARRIRRDCGEAFARGCGTAACGWCPECCAREREADDILRAAGGAAGALELMENFGDVADGGTLLRFCEMFCAQASRATKLCAAGKLLAAAGLPPAKQCEAVREMVRRMSEAEGKAKR